MASLSARDFELLKMPTIASQMPVEFPNGAYFSEFKGECQGCRIELPDDVVRGSVVKHTNAMFALEACGVCHDCHLVTRFIYRFHDDMTLTGQRSDGWHKWGGKKPTLLERIFG